MNYMLIIHEPRGQRATRSLEEGKAVFAQMIDFAEELKTAGKLRAVESLQGEDKGRRVQVRDGQARLMDGPFAEAKEFVGGLFIVDCGSFDEAVAIAQRCPAAQWATVEVRAAGPCFT